MNNQKRLQLILETAKGRLGTDNLSEISRQVGVNRNALQRIVNGGSKELRGKNLRNFATFLGVSAEELEKHIRYGYPLPEEVRTPTTPRLRSRQSIEHFFSQFPFVSTPDLIDIANRIYQEIWRRIEEALGKTPAHQTLSKFLARQNLDEIARKSGMERSRLNEIASGEVLPTDAEIGYIASITQVSWVDLKTMVQKTHEEEKCSNGH